MTFLYFAHIPFVVLFFLFTLGFVGLNMWGGRPRPRRTPSSGLPAYPRRKRP